MLSLFDRTSLEHALTLPLPKHLRELLHRRINQIIDDGLADLTHLLVIEEGDTEAMVQREIGFSPLEVEGVRVDEPSFIPRWDGIFDHGSVYEMIFCIGNDGFAFVLLVQHSTGGAWPELREACRREVGGRGAAAQLSGPSADIKEN